MQDQAAPGLTASSGDALLPAQSTCTTDQDPVRCKAVLVLTFLVRLIMVKATVAYGCSGERHWIIRHIKMSASIGLTQAIVSSCVCDRKSINHFRPSLLRHDGRIHTAQGQAETGV